MLPPRMSQSHQVPKALKVAEKNLTTTSKKRKCQRESSQRGNRRLCVAKERHGDIAVEKVEKSETQRRETKPPQRKDVRKSREKEKQRRDERRKEFAGDRSQEPDARRENTGQPRSA